MTKEQFENVIQEFTKMQATKKVFARVGPGEDDSYLIILSGAKLYRLFADGIIISRGRNHFYLPFELVVAFDAE